MTPAARSRAADAAIATLLGAGTIAYLMAMPRNLGSSDEGYYLYHSVRVLRGEVLYRDISELITPLYIQLMALLFRVFGTDFAVARAAAAVIQAATAVVVYGTCRAIGVSRPLAAAAPALQLGIGHSCWPFATPHWLGTLLVSVLLLLALDRNRARRTGWLVAQGVIVGLVTANRHPTGVVMLVAVAATFVVDALAARRWDGPPAPVVRPVAVVAAVSVVVAAAFIGPYLVWAGARPLYRQLVLHPLTGYREANQVRWGEVGIFSGPLARYTYPKFLKWFPGIVIAVATVRAAVAWLRAADAPGAVRLAILALFGAFAVLSILYNPDFIHITFALPVLLVLAADAITCLATTARVAALAPLVGVGLLVFAGYQLRDDRARARAEFPFPAETPFGHVDFASAREVDGFAHIRDLLDATPDRAIFMYPAWAAAYLVVDGRNPTRHDLIAPNYQDDEEIQGVITALERRRPRYIQLLPPLIHRGDPVARYVRLHYVCDAGWLCVRRPVPLPDDTPPG